MGRFLYRRDGLIIFKDTLSRYRHRRKRLVSENNECRKLYNWEKLHGCAPEEKRFYWVLSESDENVFVRNVSVSDYRSLFQIPNRAVQERALA